MIERGLKLCRRIDIYCLESHDHALAIDRLANDDWESLTSFYEILRPFKKETMNLQGHGTTGSYGTAWEVLPTIYRLLKHTREKQAEYLNIAMFIYGDPKSHHIYHSLTLCIKKLEKYQNLLSQTPIYAAATVMNPTKKWAWFDQRRPEYKDKAELGVQQIWDDFYKNRLPTPFPSSVTVDHPGSNTDDDCLDNEPFSEVDPYTEYCQASRISDQSCKPKDLANWWRAHPQMKVSRMAWDTLAIPAMSA